MNIPKLARLKTIVTLTNGREYVVLDIAIDTLETFAFLNVHEQIRMAARKLNR